MDQLESWILDSGELNAALDEEGTKRYIAMTCHTDSPEAEKAYLHFVEQLEPQAKPRQFRLEELYLAHPLRGTLPEARYAVFDRNTKVHVELFRPENVPLETEETKLGQQYQKLSGSLTVQFQGEERTLVQMARYLEEPDRALRQEAWELAAKRRLQEAEKFEEIFDQLLKLRAQIAANAGFPATWNTLSALEEFDYTRRLLALPRNHRARNHAAVCELQSERRQHLQLSAPPQDLAVDPRNCPRCAHLAPSISSERCAAGVRPAR